MAPYQFHIGQTVYLRPSAFTRNAAAGMYEIRAVLPEEEASVSDQKLDRAT